MSGYGKGAEGRKRSTALAARDGQTRLVQPLAEPLPVPNHLDEQGAVVWERFMTERYATVTAAEVHIIERYCELQDRRTQLRDLLHVEGWGVPGSRAGMIVINPAAQMLTTCETEIRQMERMLGLGPAFRAKLAIDLIGVEEGLERVDRTRRQASPAGGADDPRLGEPIDVDAVETGA